MAAPQTLLINEIFYSIQGESTHAGRPCIFVRLRGCPLRCTYCDTTYAFHEGEAMDFAAIFEEIKKYPCKLVELTGGEPLSQVAAKEFMAMLVANGYEVLLETSGAISLKGVPDEVKVIMDLKTPTSGELHRNCLENIPLLKSGKDEVKFVIGSKEDFVYAEQMTKEFSLHERNTVLVSPSFQKITNKELADWVLVSSVPFRMQIQLHKYIWDPNERGV